LPFHNRILPYIFIISSFFSAFLSSPIFSAEIQSTKVKLQLFWHHQFEFAGFYAAISQGYFDKYNIDVELVKFDPTLDTTDLVLTEKAQFGLAGTELIESYHQGKDVILLASYFKRSPLIIITQPEITSLKQLTNNKVFGRKQHLEQGSIREMLNLFDVEQTKINMAIKGDSIVLFENQEIEGILTYRTNTPYILNQKNIEYRIYDPNQFGIASQDLNLFTTGKFAKENPEVVKNFTLAANEGWEYAVKHPNEIIELIKSDYNPQNLTTDALKFEANETIKLISPELFEVGSIQKNKLVTISEESFANKSISSIKNLDNFVFEHNPKQKIDSELLKSLTLEEKKYLNEYPLIRVQNDDDYPPFNYLIDGKPSGYSVDLIDLIVTMLGIKVELITGKSWIEYKEMLKHKELDVLVNIIDLESNHDFAGFTSPYAGISTFAVSRTKEVSSVITIDNLTSKRIAITQGYAINKTLKNSLPKSTFIPVKDTTEALKLISTNQADVYFESGAVLDYYLAKELLSNLQLLPVSPDLNVINQEFSIATHKDNKILLSILQKTMNAIPDIEQIRLKRKWFGESIKHKSIEESFTLVELEYIKNTTVTLCRPNMSEETTLSTKIVDFINQPIGLKIKVSRRLSWSDSLAALQNKGCDLLPSATNTSQRQKTMAFTPGYFRDKVSIVTKKDQEAIFDLSEHLAQTFSIIGGLSVIKLLKKHYPSIKLIEVDTPLMATKLVQQGAVFGFIYPKTFTINLFDRHDLSDLKINASLRSQFDDVQAIATRKNDRLLHSILSKAVKNVDKQALEKLILNSSTNQTSVIFNDTEKEYLQFNQVTWCRSDTSDVWEELMPYLFKGRGMGLIQSEKMTWNEAFKALISGECDFLPEATKTAERSEIMNFTQPIHQEERVIVTQNKQPFIADIRDYLDKEFVLHQGDILYEQLKSGYPTIKVRLVEHQREGLILVKNGNAFAYIGSISDTGNKINKFSITGLKIAGTLSDKYNDSWGFATRKSDIVLSGMLTETTRKNDIVLSGILSKIIDNADKNKVREIISGQLSVKYEKGFDYTLFWQLLLLVIFVLAVVIFWNRRLAALNFQMQISKKAAEEAQKKVEIQNKEILSTHQQLVQSEKMASLGTLTAGVAHEINNPTNFTHAAVYMMQSEIEDIKVFLKQLAGGDNADEAIINSFDEKFEKLIELTKTAREGSERIKVIVEDLRTFARLDNAKQASSKMSDLVNSTVNLVKAQFEDITIHTDFTFDPVINCYPSKLNQVFMNIVVNACQSIEAKVIHNKASSDKDKFEARITISFFKDDNNLVIKISDNGWGMDELTKQKVCEPFFTTKVVGNGTGLGMAISFGIIEEHGGMLKISSVLEKGSEFSIYLPVK